MLLDYIFALDGYLVDQTRVFALGGLPEAKTHCASLTVNALREAIADWHIEAKLRR